VVSLELLYQRKVAWIEVAGLLQGTLCEWGLLTMESEPYQGLEFQFEVEAAETFDAVDQMVVASGLEAAVASVAYD